MIDVFTIAYDKFIERLMEIENYLSIINSEKINKENKGLRHSPVPYNAVVISIYSCYENYIDDLLEIYIDEVLKICDSFECLPIEFRKNNLIISSEFINNPQRFKNYNINEDDVIKNIYSGTITKRLLLKHAGNMSLNVLSEFFRNLGIDELKRKTMQQDAFITYFMNRDETTKEKVVKMLNSSEQIFEILEIIIRQRNFIAHSWNLDDIVSYDIIKSDWMEFLKSFCESIYYVVIQNFSEQIIKNNKALKMLNPILYGSSVIGFESFIYCFVEKQCIIVRRNNYNTLAFVKSVKKHMKGFTIKLIDIYGHDLKLKVDKILEYEFFYYDKLLSKSDNIASADEDAHNIKEEKILICP